MPRYEHRVTRKFWEISVEGDVVVRRSGPIGGEGKPSRFRDGCALAAQLRAEQAILEKEAEGYRLVGAREPWPGPGRDDAPPEAGEAEGLLRDPREPESTLVYGDWLQARGAPRGELITVQHQLAQARGSRAAELRKAEERILARHGEALLGHLHELRDLVELEWNVGFIGRARLGAARGDGRGRARRYFGEHQRYWVLRVMAAELFALRSARFLEALSLESVGSDCYPLDFVAEHAPPTLHTLEVPLTPALRATLTYLQRQWWGASITQTNGVWLARRPLEMPRLKALRIEPGLQAHAPGLAPFEEQAQVRVQRRRRVERLERVSGLAFLCQSQLPSLEVLELGCDGPGSQPGDLRPVLEGAFPALQHLTLRALVFVEPFLAELLASRSLRGLRTLALPQAAFTDAHARLLAQHRRGLPRLERLDLAGTHLTAVGRRALEAAGLTVTLASTDASSTLDPGAGASATSGAGRASSASPPAAIGAAVTLERALGQCPDAAAQAAARTVAVPASWSELGRNAERAWGRYAGSSGEYRVGVTLGTLASRCTCPSRKRPCKHGLGLLLLLADSAVTPGQRPRWAR